MTHESFDDAIHAERNGKALCHSDGSNLLSWFLYPCSDVGLSYCWSCLRITQIERFPNQPLPSLTGPSDDFMRRVSEALRAVST